MHLLLQAGGEQSGQRQHRADRQVDAAGADHHQHAEAQEAVGDELARDVDEIALGQECVGRYRREDDEQQDRRREQQVGAAEALQQGRLRMRRRGHGLGQCSCSRRGVLRREAGRMRENGFGPERVAREFGGDAASRTTSSLSDMPSTSGISEEISSTATPLSARLRSSGRSRPWWRCRRRASARRR